MNNFSLRNEEILKKIDKINQSVKQQKQNSLQKFNEAQNRIKMRHKKIKLKKASFEDEYSTNSVRILSKHSENIRISNEINDFYDLKRVSIQQKSMADHIINEKKLKII